MIAWRHRMKCHHFVTPMKEIKCPTEKYKGYVIICPKSMSVFFQTVIIGNVLIDFRQQSQANSIPTSCLANPFMHFKLNESTLILADPH